MKDEEVLAELLPQEFGHYVDVGANRPDRINLTYQFYQRGWYGVLIEPVRRYVDMLKEKRPRDQVVMIAASDKRGVASMRQCGPLSTLEETWPLKKGKFTRIDIPTDTLDNILKDFPQIKMNCAFCNIDVEGHEQKVLEGIDFNSFRPKVFCIEALEYKTKRQLWKNWEPILLDVGYKLHGNGKGLNRFYTLGKSHWVR